jgi:hypothetical protein
VPDPSSRVHSEGHRAHRGAWRDRGPILSLPAQARKVLCTRGPCGRIQAMSGPRRGKKERVPGVMRASTGSVSLGGGRFRGREPLPPDGMDLTPHSLRGWAGGSRDWRGRPNLPSESTSLSSGPCGPLPEEEASLAPSSRFPQRRNPFPGAAVAEELIRDPHHSPPMTLPERGRKPICSPWHFPSNRRH